MHEDSPELCHEEVHRARVRRAVSPVEVSRDEQCSSISYFACMLPVVLSAASCACTVVEATESSPVRVSSLVDVRDGRCAGLVQSSRPVDQDVHVDQVRACIVLCILRRARRALQLDVSLLPVGEHARRQARLVLACAGADTGGGMDERQSTSPCVRGVSRRAAERCCLVCQLVTRPVRMPRTLTLRAHAPAPAALPPPARPAVQPEVFCSYGAHHHRRRRRASAAEPPLQSDAAVARPRRPRCRTAADDDRRSAEGRSPPRFTTDHRWRFR